ncbi:MAG: hypothetical protein LBH13_06925 [Cellulomonadaceae bacterium]|jgi:multicomponent Na+:H+ antiporter subunit F|nr:hypothetical protein [Cellulomonadaceae bacterium]
MFLSIVTVVLLLASLGSAVLVLWGASRWTRLLGYVLVASKVNMVIIVLATATGYTFYLDIAVVYILLSFIGTLVLANYMANKGGVSE